jgi:hypothetical protein
LLVDEPGDLLVAVAGVVPRRLAAEELVEVGVEIVGLSLMAKPWGRSSRSRSVSKPPDFGV